MDENTQESIKKRPKKHIKAIIVSIVLLLMLGTILYLIYRHTTLLDETVDVDYSMPEIVFLYSEHKNYENNKEYAIDRYGNVYFIEKDTGSYVDILEQYESGQLQKQWKKVTTIDQAQVQEKYNLLKKIVKNKDFDVVSTLGYVLDYIPIDSYWTGIYYDDNEELQAVTLYHSSNTQYEATDERAYKIVAWMNRYIDENLEPDFDHSFLVE